MTTNGIGAPEGVDYKFVCPGCDSSHKTTVPKHGVPFMWTCQKDTCGWAMQIQSDDRGFSVGWNKPVPPKPDLRLVN